MMAEITKKVSTFTSKTRQTFWQLFSPEWRRFTLASVFGLGLFATFFKFNTSVNFPHLCYAILGLYGIFVTGHTLNELKNGKDKSSLLDEFKQGVGLATDKNEK